MRPEFSGRASGYVGKSRRAQRLRIDSALNYIRQCPERYFLTLTTKRRFEPLAMSRLVSEWQHRLNRQLFGTAYSRKKYVRLATYAVQELNFDQGVHTHLLVGIPEGALSLKTHRLDAPFEAQALSVWCALDHSGRIAGQDATPISNFEGICRYIHKTVRFDIDNVDVMNTHIPSISPTVLPYRRDNP
jgi:hypothetical protein